MTKENAERGATSAVICIQMQETWKAGKQHFFDRLSLMGPSLSVDDNEDIDYIAGIAVESANICALEPSDNSRLPKEIFSEMLIDDKPIKFQVDRGSSINILAKEVVGNCNLAPTSQTRIMWNKTEVTPFSTTRIIVTNP